MTELTLILNSVHTSNDSLQRRRVPLRMVTSIESDCSEQGDKTEIIRIIYSVHTSNYSLQRLRVPLSMVTSLESDCS
jgi:hypothetical protein